MKSWYLLQTKPRQERLAKEHLERQEYGTYLPLTLFRRKRRGKLIRVIDPMFPRYLFIHLSDETDDWRPIRSTIGVAALVRFGQEPARVPDNLIQCLRSREDAEGILIPSTKDYVPGDKLRIAEGPFEGYEAIFSCNTAKKRVIVLLKIAESFIKLELDQSLIE